MFLFFAKILFRIVKPKTIFVFGQYRMTTIAALMSIFASSKTGPSLSYMNGSSPRALFFGLLRLPEIICIIFKDADDALRYGFLQKSAKERFLILTGAVDIPYGIEVFASEKEAAEPFVSLVKSLKSGDGFVVLDDDVTFRDLKDGALCEVHTFGFHSDGDVYVSNLSLLTDEKFLDQGKGIMAVLNAKINTQKQSLPLWLYNVAGRSHLYGVAASSALALMFGMNLLEIAEALKEYRPPRGYMRILQGKKQVTILDDSVDATLFSMFEAVETLDNFAGKKRIAVIGDLVGLSETESAMRNIATQAIKRCDILVAVGNQANIVVDEASSRGFPRQNLHAFENASQTAAFLQNAIKGGEVILIDGAKELHLQEVVRSLV